MGSEMCIRDRFMDNVDTALAEVIEGLEWVRDSFDTEMLGVK